MQQRSLHQAGFILTVALAVAAAQAAPTDRYLGPDDVDWRAVLSGPPAAGSPEQARDLDAVLQWQSKRTPSDVDRCRAEATDPSPFVVFAGVLGDGFNDEALPITAHVLEQANKDLKQYTKPAKKNWKRPRPVDVDPRVHPCVPVEATASYPSAHAVRGVVWAAILSDFFPDKRAQLIARGNLLGDDRVIAGEHFPSDVAAGQNLGTAVVAKLMESSVFQEQLKQAKAEVASRYKPSAATRPAR